MINVSGHRVGTAEVEGALVSHDVVDEAAVCGYVLPIPTVLTISSPKPANNLVWLDSLSSTLSVFHTVLSVRLGVLGKRVILGQLADLCAATAFAFSLCVL